MAMNALDRELVRRDIGIVQLLTPPFDKSSLNPGYIKGYVPGVRENGGQYTHAAVWAAMAFALARALISADGLGSTTIMDLTPLFRQPFNNAEPMRPAPIRRTLV